MAKKILLVEDEKDICDLYALNLSNAGFDVTKAYNGNQALQNFQSQKYDILLLDIMLPDINGIEVLKKLRTDHKTVKIIMLTNLTADKTINEAYENGADGYLLKATLTRESLVEEINTFIE